MHSGQVLPPSMLLLAEPQPETLVAALEAALARVPTVARLSQHCQVRVPWVLSNTRPCNTWQPWVSYFFAVAS